MRAIRLDQAAGLAAAAQVSVRLRHHLPLHAEADAVRRVLIGLHPGTYVRPHAHQRTGSWRGTETLVVLQGAIGVIEFSPSARMSAAVRLGAGGLVEVPDGCGHTVVCLEEGTVVLEVKEGRAPDPDRQWLPGFPPEGDPECREAVHSWELAVRLGEGHRTSG